MRTIQVACGALVLIVTLTGCSLFGGGAEPTATPIPTEGPAAPPASPSEPPTAAPTEEPSGQGGGSAGTAGPGDILFIRGGQVWAVGSEGGGERPITPTATDSRLEHLALSPDGRYLAFTLNSVELDLVDLQQGIMTTLDAMDAGSLGPLAWGLDSANLFYHRLTLDPATFLPTRSAVMHAAIPPAEGGPMAVVESDLASGPLIYPGFALDGQMLVQHIAAATGGVGEWFTLDLASATQTPVQAGFAVADVSPDGTRLLLFRQEDAALGGAVPIYVADFGLGGALNPVQLSPVGETAAYSSPRFGPDGSRILAIRRDLSQGGAPAQIALLEPNENGSYVVTPLAGLEDFDVVAFAWNGANGVVAQGIPVGGTIPELWVLSLDGSTPAARLTTGEFPLVVPGS